jgi:acetylglutamate/LysW-gamma-L-alpha-aminoadipate kinase
MKGNLIVVKMGGARDIEHTHTCQDAATLISRGCQLILVHGASERANQLCLELGHPIQFLHSPSGYVSRYTDLRTRDIFVQAVTEINNQILIVFKDLGLKAVGLVDKDSCILHGHRKEALRALVDGKVLVIRDDYSGLVDSVDVRRLRTMLESGITPVVPPLALSDTEGLLNIDGDYAAALIAAAVGADQLIFLSNVPGLLRDYDDDNSLLNNVSREGMEYVMKYANGRMKRKIQSVSEALQLGVNRAVVADGRLPTPLQRALNGGGTHFG